jgi:hypothetical protein
MKSRLVTPLFRKSGLLLAFSSLMSLPLQAADPATVLPDESVAYLEVDNAGIYKLENHPVAKAFPLAELKALFYKLSGTSADYEEETKKFLAQETGVSYDDLVKKMGRLAFSLHDLKIPSNPTPENVRMEFSIAEEVDADEAFVEKYIQAMVKLVKKEIEKQGKTSGNDIDKVLGKLADLFDHSTVEHAGAKIHVFKLKDTDETKGAPDFVREWAFTVYNKMLLGSSGQDQVEEMVDRLKAGGETGSLAASSYYKADHDKTGKSLAVASLNLETIGSLVEKYALPLAEGSDIDAKKIWTTLGGDKLKSAVLAMNGAEETIDLAALLTYSEKPGLLALPAIPGAGTPPSFFPKDLSSASYQQLDLSKTFENVEKLVTEVYPPAGPALNLGLNMVQQQTGVDLRKEIIDQLGPDIWSVSSVSKEEVKLDSGKPNGLMAMSMGKEVLGIRVKDSKAVGLAIKTLINKAGQEDALFEKQEYQGFTINVIKDTPNEFKVGWVLTDDWLILSIGDQPALEQVLSRLSKKDTDGFFSQKRIAKHIEAMRDGQAVTSVSNIGDSLKELCTILGMIVESSGVSEAKAIPFDKLSKLLDVPLIGVSKAWIDAKHAEFRIRIAPKGE